MKTRLAVLIAAALLAGVLVFQAGAAPDKEPGQAAKVRPQRKGCKHIKCEQANGCICCKNGKQAKCECSPEGEPRCHCQ